MTAIVVVSVTPLPPIARYSTTLSVNARLNNLDQSRPDRTASEETRLKCSKVHLFCWFLFDDSKAFCAVPICSVLVYSSLFYPEPFRPVLQVNVTLAAVGVSSA